MEDLGTDKKIYCITYIIANDILGLNKKSDCYKDIIDGSIIFCLRYDRTVESKLEEIGEIFDKEVIRVSYKSIIKADKYTRESVYITGKIEILDFKECDVILGTLNLYNFISESSRKILFSKKIG